MNAVGTQTIVKEHPLGGLDWSPARQDDLLLPQDRLLRASEVQRELGISRATAYRMMADGTLPIYRFGGRNGRRAMIRVSLQELRAWIAAHKTASRSAT